MPKNINQIKLNIDLLKPQSEPPKIFVSFIKWALSAGRYLIIFVEIIVLAAFVTRFKLDADIATNKETIDSLIPFLESLKPDELLIRQTQSQLASIKDLKQNRTDYIRLINAIAAQVPAAVILRSMTFEEEKGGINIKLIGVAQNHSELSSLISGLKKDQTFTEVSLSSVGLDQGLLNFSIICSTTTGGGSQL